MALSVSLASCAGRPSERRDDDREGQRGQCTERDGTSHGDLSLSSFKTTLNSPLLCHLGTDRASEAERTRSTFRGKEHASSLLLRDHAQTGAARHAPRSEISEKNQLFKTAFKAAPMSAGLWATLIPAASSAAILSEALPEPPETIVPAWPMRLPGERGLTGDERGERFGELAGFLEFRRLFLGVAADLAHHQDRVGVGIGLEQLKASTKLVPLTGSPPMPTQVLWPIPRVVNCQTPSYVSVPDRLTTPTRPAL